MVAPKVDQITLDYAGASGLEDILRNLSGVAVEGTFLWTASDEGRTVECLKPDRAGYSFHTQVRLDDVFPGLPNDSNDRNKPEEADIESLAICNNALWICGSHCRVRRQTKEDRQKERDKLPYPLRPDFRRRAGRHLLGRVALKDGGGGVAKRGSHLPFKGESGSLHSILKGNPFIWPFIGLPSKENGLDIEGFTTPDGKALFFGLRGPRVDRYAVVLELKTNGGLDSTKQKIVTHFLDLDGGAVRDLAQLSDKEILVLAGPVGEAPGPFGLYLWQPRQSPCAQLTTNLHWPINPIQEKPEGIARLERNGTNGIIVLYDSPDPCKRISGSRYLADWFPFP